jgi:hypothetical protein
MSRVCTQMLNIPRRGNTLVEMPGYDQIPDLGEVARCYKASSGRKKDWHLHYCTDKQSHYFRTYVKMIKRF